MSTHDKRHVAFGPSTKLDWKTSQSIDENEEAAEDEGTFETGDFYSAASGEDEEATLPIEDRRGMKRKDPDLGMEFTRWREAVVVVCFVFYVSDLLLDAWVLRTFLLADNVRQAWFMGFCMLIPNLYAGYKSLQWYLRAFRDQVGPRTSDPKLWLIRVLFFPISLVLRYYEVLRLGYTARAAAAKGACSRQRDVMVRFVSESSEVAMLRLFVIFLEDAPICVLNLMLVFATGPEDINDVGFSVGVVVAKLSFSISLGVVHYASVTKVAWHACHFTAGIASDQGKPMMSDSDNSSILTTRSSRRSLRNKNSIPIPAKTKQEFHKRASMTPAALILLYCWQLTTIGSRLVCYALFASVFHVWVPLLAAIRWIINTVWILVDVPNMSLANCASFGGVYLFTFVSTSTSAQYFRVALYYLLNVIEAVSVSAVWWNLRWDSPYHVLGFSLLVAGTILSILLMIIYYAFGHPNRKNTWGWKMCTRSDAESTDL